MKKFFFGMVLFVCACSMSINAGCPPLEGQTADGYCVALYGPENSTPTGYICSDPEGSAVTKNCKIKNTTSETVE